MNHEKAIKNLDKLFKSNAYTVEEETFAKATALTIMAQLKVYKETNSEHLDTFLGHTFGSVLNLFARDLSDESRNKIQSATEFFIDQLNGETHEHQQSH